MNLPGPQHVRDFLSACGCRLLKQDSVPRSYKVMPQEGAGVENIWKTGERGPAGQQTAGGWDRNCVFVLESLRYFVYI
jgi:hypothetical protein